MATYDPKSGDVSDVAAGLEANTVLGGQPSLLSDVSDFVLKGAPLTGMSIINSVANTGVEVANLFGADIPKIPGGWGIDTLQDYYNAHKEGVETAGLVAGGILGYRVVATGVAKSLAVAADAVKGVKLSGAISDLSGLLPAVAKDNAISFMENDIKNGLGLYKEFTAQKAIAISAGYASHFMEQFAVGLTLDGVMHANPLLDDQSFSDLTKNTFYGAVLGSSILGSLDGFFLEGKINQLKYVADRDSKLQEHLNILGAGQNPGDQLMTTLQDINRLKADAANQDLNALQQFKATQTVKQAENLAVQSLGKIAGDQQVGSALYKVISKQFDDIRLSAGSDPDAMDSALNYWAGAMNIGRYSAELPAVSTGEHIFVNNFVKGTSPGIADLGKLFTPETDMVIGENGQLVAPHANVDTSYRYRVTPDAKIVTTSAGQTFESGGKSFVITAAREAFDAGADVFINKNGQVLVNPDSTALTRVPRVGETSVLPQYAEREYRATGSIPEQYQKPFVSDPQYIDTVTGAVSYEVSPTIGDFGPVKISGNRITAGEKSFTHSITRSLGEEISEGAPLDPVAENSRNVLFGTRGIQKGDALAADDPAALDSLYRDFKRTGGNDFPSWLQSLTKRGVTLDEEAPGNFFSSEQDLLGFIQSQKGELYQQLLSAHDGYSEGDLQRILNIPPHKVQPVPGSAVKAEDIIDDLENSSDVRHVKVQFKLGSTKTNDGMVRNAMQDVQYRINVIRGRQQDAVRSANRITAGAVPQLEDIALTKSSTDAIIDAAGSNFLEQSQGAYGGFRQQAERIGQVNANAYEVWKKRLADAFAPLNRALRTPEAREEFQTLSNFRTTFHSSGENWYYLSDDLMAQHFPHLNPAEQKVAVLKNSLVQAIDAQGNPIEQWNSAYRPDGFLVPPLDGTPTTAKGLRTYFVFGKLASQFLDVHGEFNATAMQAERLRRGAVGLMDAIDPRAIYIPPLDTRQYPHFFIAKAKTPELLGRNVSQMVVASDADALMQKRLMLEKDFHIYTKDELKEYFKAHGEYERASDFWQAKTDSSLARTGVLSDIIPSTNPEAVLNSFYDFHARQGLAMLRNYTELANMQTMTELDALGAKYTQLQTSTVSDRTALPSIGRTPAYSPYEDLKRTMLNISPKESYQFWNQTNEAVERFADTAFNKMAAAVKSITLGKADAEEAGAAIERDLGWNPFADAVNGMARFGESNKLPQARYLSRIIRANNAVMGAMVIKFDPLQQLLHALSTPVLMTAEGFHAMSGGLGRELLQTELPGDPNTKIWAVAKPVYTSIKNFFSPGKLPPEQLALYKKVLDGRDMGAEYTSGFADLSMPLGTSLDDTRFAAYMKKINTFLGKPMRLTESFTNFATVDTAHQIFSALGYQGQELEDNMRTFVNRVKANINTAQRPIAFQGPIGQAVGLFQTYYLNMMQSLLRYYELSEGKTLGLLMGMQGTLFGVQGLPGVNMINQAVATANGNHAHADIYSALPNYMGQDLAKWILYGSVSNVLNNNIYQRSNINPREISIIPTNPMEWPGISGPVRLVKDISDVFSKIQNGGDAYSALMMGLEHNGLSRPLTGLAELIQGYSTTTKGGVISNTTPQTQEGLWSELLHGSWFARLLGGRPLDEAIALNDMYRRNLFNAQDRAKVEALGEAVKSKLIGGKELTPDEVHDFAARYAATGGNVDAFNRSLVRWQHDARHSIANKVFDHLKDPRAQQAMVAMGGVPLPDYSAPPPMQQHPSTQPAKTAVPQTQQSPVQ